MKLPPVLSRFPITFRWFFCLVLFAAGAESLIGQGSNWPPMTKELIERLENLPRERAVVHKEADTRSGKGTASDGDLHLIEHWKPLLIVLLGRAEKLSKSDAEARYGQIMEVVGLLTHAEFESVHGELTAAGRYYLIEPAFATENLLAHYARLVMQPDHWDMEQWRQWQQQWAAVVAEAPSPDAEVEETATEDAGRIALIGDWVASDGADSFASASITARRLVLVWQENPESPVQRMTVPLHRVDDDRIYASPDDVGLVYLLSRDDEGRDLLSLEMRSEDPALVRFELEMVREEE